MICKLWCDHFKFLCACCWEIFSLDENERNRAHSSARQWLELQMCMSRKESGGKGADNYQLIFARFQNTPSLISIWIKCIVFYVSNIIVRLCAIFFCNRQLIPCKKQTNKINKTKNPFIDAHTHSWEILNRLDNLICLDLIPQLVEKFVVLSYSFDT